MGACHPVHGEEVNDFGRKSDHLYELLLPALQDSVGITDVIRYEVKNSWSDSRSLPSLVLSNRTLIGGSEFDDEWDTPLKVGVTFYDLFSAHAGLKFRISGCDSQYKMYRIHCWDVRQLIANGTWYPGSWDSCYLSLCLVWRLACPKNWERRLRDLSIHLVHST